MTSQAHSLKLSGELGLRDADAIREQLLDALFTQQDVTIDAQDLAAIDMSVIQVLISAHTTAKGQNKTLQIFAPNGGPLQNALLRAGLLSNTADAPLTVRWQAGGAT